MGVSIIQEPSTSAEESNNINNNKTTTTAATTTTQVPTDSSDYGNWTQPAVKEYCVADPGLAWEDRNDISCEIRWPQGRWERG